MVQFFLGSDFFIPVNVFQTGLIFVYQFFISCLRKAFILILGCSRNMGEFLPHILPTTPQTNFYLSPLNYPALIYNFMSPYSYNLTLHCTSTQFFFFLFLNLVHTKNWTTNFWICLDLKSYFISTWPCTQLFFVASMSIFLDITSYWSQTDMRKINWFEKKNWFEKYEPKLKLNHNIYTIRWKRHFNCSTSY